MVYVHELHVTPRRQRTGLGSRLMRCVKAAAWANVTSKGILLTRWRNAKDSSADFYKFHGFSPTDLADPDALYEIWVHWLTVAARP